MHVWLKTFVVHFADLEASIYWPIFPSSFLCKIRSGGFKDPLEPLETKHTRPCNLLDLDSRTEFVLNFIALVLYVPDGPVNVGQLRRPGIVIHRTVKPGDSTTEDEVVKPPQAALDDYELANWVQDSAELYES